MGACVIDIAALQAWASAILEKAGASRHSARVTARVLVDANRRGIDSHGVSLLQVYLPSLRADATRGQAEPSIATETSATAVVDGHSGLGPYVASYAMELCIRKAKNCGAGAVGVRNSNHYGAASAYAEQAAGHGCIGISFSNCDPGLAPLGALGPILGTNPLAIAAPADGAPISLDMATSVAAQRKVTIAARSSRRIPSGWAMGPDGRATTDPRQALAGAMLPMAHHKGFALAFMLDVLCGCLTGSAISPDIPSDPENPVPQQIGHLFLALSVEHFGDPQEYRSALSRLQALVRDAPRLAGTEPFRSPGERAAATAGIRTVEGVPFDGDSAVQLRQLGIEYGIPFPDAI